MQARTGPSLYQRLESLPDGLTGELLAGQLHAQPRPSRPHAFDGTRRPDRGEL